MNDLGSVYQSRRADFAAQAGEHQSKANSLSWLRVGCMLLFLLTIYFILYLVLPWLAIVAALLLVGYIALVSRHSIVKRKQSLYQQLTAINANELQAIKGDSTAFPEGAEYIDQGHPFSADLDLFGRGSLFQLINRAGTEIGRDRFAAMLKSPLADRASIEKRQHAVKELSENLEFRQLFMATGLIAPEQKRDVEGLLGWLELPDMVRGKAIYKVLMLVAPVVAFAGLITWVLTGTAVLFVASMLIQWAIVGWHTKQVTMLQEYIGGRRRLLDKFADHIELLSNHAFKSALLADIHREAQTASLELKTLAARSRALDLRLNIFSAIFLNGTVLYDLQCVNRLEAWREKNRSKLPGWLAQIAEVDALNGLATFAANNPSFAYPTVGHELLLDAKALGHPLLRSEERICNDFVMSPSSKLMIVTGANMAGKSTFLRAVGVNVVLGLCGSVVCASSMKCPILDIHSGMRNTDSIADHQSYFFAELLRLEHITKKLKEGKPMLVLLDEILKGTNSVDKLTGSQELVKQLVDFPALVLIATHDVGLGELADQYAEIRNVHFETFINGKELSFDYLLKDGVSTGKNATFLMKQMGIIPQD